MKQSIQAYVASLGDQDYERVVTELHKEAGVPDDVWGVISDSVAQALYREYQTLFYGPRCAEFLLMIDAGQYVDCRQMNFSRPQCVAKKKRLM